MLVAQDPSSGHHATTIWDSGIVLARYFQGQKWRPIRGKRVLELGAGTGVVGLSCALGGARSVWLTDLPEWLRHLQERQPMTEVAAGQECGVFFACFCQVNASTNEDAIVTAARTTSPPPPTHTHTHTPRRNYLSAFSLRAPAWCAHAHTHARRPVCMHAVTCRMGCRATWGCGSTASGCDLPGQTYCGAHSKWYRHRLYRLLARRGGPA